jgi:hypothetical protein
MTTIIEVPVLIRHIPPKTVKDFCMPEGQSLELFLPYDSVSRGYIACWSPSEGHNEASLEFYWGTKPPHAYMKQAEALFNRYEKFCASVEPRVRLRRVVRLPNDWREKAWSRS